jgi:hypothetical protein
MATHNFEAMAAKLDDPSSGMAFSVEALPAEKGGATTAKDRKG